MVKAKEHLKKWGFLATPVKNLVELYESMPLSQFLPYVSYHEDGFYILADGRAAAVFEVPPLVLAGDNYLFGCRELISAVPDGSIIQFTLYASPNIEPFLERWRIKSHSNNTFVELSNKAVEYYKQFTKKPHPFMGVPFRDFRLFISIVLPPPGGVSVAAGFLEKLKEWIGLAPFEEEDVSEYEKYLLSARDLFLSIKGSIESMGFASNVEPLKPNYFLSVLKEIFNPSHTFSRAVNYDPEMDIREQLIYADNAVVLHEPDLMEIDGKYCGVFSVKSFPGGVYHIQNMLEIAGALLTRDKAKQLPYPFLVTGTIYKLTEAEEMKIVAKLSNYRSSYKPDVIQKYVKIRDQVQELQVYEDLRVRNKALARLVRVAITGFYFFDAPSKQDAKREVVNIFNTKVKKLWESAGFEVQLEKFKFLPTFIFSLPAAAAPETMKFLNRGKTILLSSSPNLMPVQADWKGTGWYKRPDYPGFLFFSRRGQAQLVSLWDSDTNYNLFIAAQSGSGKSFLMNYLIVNFRARGGIVYGIDVGRSYQRIVDILDGQMIVFDSKLCINPFTNSILVKVDEILEKGLMTEKELKEEITKEKEQLVRLIAKMAGLPASGYDDLKGILEQAIEIAVAKDGKETSIRSVRNVLREFLKEPSKMELKVGISRMVESLYPYAEGRFAHFWVGEANIFIEKPFVVLELEEVEQYETMKEVVLLAMMMIFSQKIYLGDRSVPKLFFIDEAWSLLKGEHTAKFIETGYRRFRKYNTAAATITQSVLDFFKEDNRSVGQAIFGNSEFMFLLNQKREDLLRAYKEDILTMDDFAKEMLQTVMTEKGKFSEIFVRNSNTWGVMRFLVDRFSYYLFTTNPAEVAEIDQLIASGMTLPEAINEMIRRHG